MGELLLLVRWGVSLGSAGGALAARVQPGWGLDCWSSRRSLWQCLEGTAFERGLQSREALGPLAATTGRDTPGPETNSMPYLRPGLARARDMEAIL